MNLGKVGRRDGNSVTASSSRRFSPFHVGSSSGRRRRRLSPALSPGPATLELVGRHAAQCGDVKTVAKRVMTGVSDFFNRIEYGTGDFLCVKCLAACDLDNPRRPISSLTHSHTTCFVNEGMVDRRIHGNAFSLPRGYCYKCCLPQESTDRWSFFDHKNHPPGARVNAETDFCRGRGDLLKVFLNSICSNRGLVLHVLQPLLPSEAFVDFCKATDADTLFELVKTWASQTDVRSGLNNLFVFVSSFVDIVLESLEFFAR